MNISEFCKNYNLHDSLLESVNYDKEKEIVTLEIDFGYWLQKNYTDDIPETGMITLIFSNVSKFDCASFSINSDEIINIENVSENELYLEVYNDITDECHNLTIIATQVEIKESDMYDCI